MHQALIRLAALCMAVAWSEQLTVGSRLREGIRWLSGLLAAGLIWQAVYVLAQALLS